MRILHLVDGEENAMGYVYESIQNYYQGMQIDLPNLGDH